MLLGADVRPWIATNASPSEVIYNENRTESPIPFNLDAFDGYATKDEVLALVSPILNVTPIKTPTPMPSEPSEPVRGLW
jgi:hypothetical protein